MKKNIYNYWIAIFFVMIGFSCNDYLDLVPDNIATMEDAFRTRNAAEKFLFSCYHYMPNPTDHRTNPAILGCDEMWWNIDEPDQNGNFIHAKKLAMGQQMPTKPLFNYWDGGEGGNNLWIGIRDCNIFLENIDIPYDLEPYEKAQWIAEVKFLKAYYHFYLFQLYGPIPIMDKNISVSAKPEDVRLYRNTVDEVVDYICNLLDEAAVDLPLRTEQDVANAGRPNKAIVLALKAKLLTLAASPLFNGNKDFDGYRDNKGTAIFGENVGTVDMKKWERAAVALKNAIDTCHLAGHKLFKFYPSFTCSDETKLKLELRYAMTERWNSEIIWGSTQWSDFFQKGHPVLIKGNVPCGTMGATLNVAERFYTNHGVPIDEDASFDYANKYSYKKCVPDADGNNPHKYYIKENQETAVLNYNREPRFYATLGFDRGIWEGAGVTDENKFYYLELRKGENGGMKQISLHNPTGYFYKKFNNPETSQAPSTFNEKRYSFPIIRLPDLYLMYAEVLNEIKPQPDAEVYKWVDIIRHRAGLEGVVESWSKYSTNPTKPLTQLGMREIIHQERNIELAGEFQRFWDLRRWKEAVKVFNHCNILGWNYKGDNAEDYYNVTTYYNQRIYSTKNYLWPISNEAILVDKNLKQNPGW